MLRQLQMPLAAIKELLARDPADAAARVAEHWRDAEAAHDARRGLAGHLVSRLSGKRSVMYEVATREIPERSLLCLKRNVEEQEMWAFGKEFIAILRERPLPKIEGREGAMLCIWWGLVNDDGNGPIEWCAPVPAAQAESLAPHYPELTLRTDLGREGAMLCIWWGLVNDDGNGPIEWCAPVPAAQAESLAPHYPELTLRTEPAHLEAFVALPDAGDEVAHWQLATGSLDAWAEEPRPEHEGDRLAFTPADLGLRITYLASAHGTEEPYRDMALPFAVER